MFVIISLSMSGMSYNNCKLGENDMISNCNEEKNFDGDNLKISKISGKIHIDDIDPSSNWSVAEDLGLCTGSGNYTHPYVIEDLVIDANGSGSCIQIENSDVFFLIIFH